jgi:hypothetical protein
MGNSSQLTKHHWKKTTTTETTRNKHGQHPEKKHPTYSSYKYGL